MPAVMTPGGPLDLSSILFRNRIIFIGQPVNSQVAQRVISQLVTLATVDEDADILVSNSLKFGSILLKVVNTLGGPSLLHDSFDILSGVVIFLFSND